PLLRGTLPATGTQTYGNIFHFKTIYKMITVTIQVKPYLAAYLQSAYAHCTIEGAIRFTKNQNLYSCLLQLTTPRPKGVSWRDQGNITFSLPCPSVGKDPRTYNYLGEEAVKILEQEINYEMRMDYYRFLRRNKFKNGMMFTRATELYLEEHGMMELIPEETLLKSYFLWVKKVEKK
ncbi:hypothetical protein, partial [Bacteroides cellulosilyticus]